MRKKALIYIRGQKLFAGAIFLFLTAVVITSLVQASDINTSDRYIEGLSKYLETISGSDNNHFLKEYNYSLFWAYLHKKYGIAKIEEISRILGPELENKTNQDVASVISLVLKEDFKDIIEGFAIAVYFKHFNPDIKKGLSELKIMSLDDFSTKSPKELLSYGSNFITLNLNDEKTPAQVIIKKTAGRESGQMKMSIFCRLENGKIAPLSNISLDDTENLCSLELSKMKNVGIKEVILIITNIDAKNPALYRLVKY